MARIGATQIEVFPLALGGNVFGWTADERQSFDVLDAFRAGGGNFIDTADSYSHWAPGNSGGESETIIGRWLKTRGNRDELVIATKVGQDPAFPGTSRAAVRRAVEGSLTRLGTSHIDLFYAHIDDLDTPLSETVGALAELVEEGKVRAVGASNFTAERLEASLRTADALGVARYQALQNPYNLVDRDRYEGALRAVVEREGLSLFPYPGLAGGFLTGKYRDPQKLTGSPRASGAARYLNESGVRLLEVLDTVAAAHGASVAAVALAWLAAQPTVAAPIASARTVDQVAPLLESTTIVLTPGQIEDLDAASRSVSPGTA
jgi:aryl-alcohol dehydrogenase-like predicted oxidoreductase